MAQAILGNPKLKFIKGMFYMAPQPPPEKYLCIEALEDGLTVSLSEKDCQYSLDKINWIDLPANTNTPAINKNERIYFKRYWSLKTRDLDFGDWYYPTFTISKKCNLLGNCNSMIFGDEAETNLDLTGYEYAFSYLFYTCSTIIDASRLRLPATTLSRDCYTYMFSGCTSLLAAPALPATTLTDSCYNCMFENCTSLVSAPALPATSLAEYCYYGMFAHCTSLVNAPTLPATTLASKCYRCMFQNCTSLASTPVLPATTLAEYCYWGMFMNCTSLVSTSELPATSLAEECYYQMFYNCTSLVSAPSILPATILSRYCYSYMFYNCTSLVTAPALPATTLITNCYQYMFDGCTKLNYIKALFTTTPSSSYTNGWVQGVSSTGTFVKSKNASWTTRGSNGIPYGWTVQTA